MIMMQTTPTPPKKLPTLVDSRHLLTMLFGNDTVCGLRRTPLTPDECAFVATYVDNEGALKRLLVCDLDFANSAGAALSAIPPASAKNATKAGKVAENVVENLSEVMNVAVNLFIESFGSRLELASVSLRADLAPDVVAALSSAQRVKFEITIPKYDMGRVDLIAV
jgi:hypothetical protein